MAELSKEAQAVLDAFHKELPPDNEPGGLAAALRAAADQVVPETDGPRSVLEYELGDWDARDDVRNALLAIAAELEGQ